MYKRMTLLPIVAILLLAPAAWADEPVVLKSGAVLLGKVEGVDADSVDFSARVPVEKRMRIARKDISDSSLWRILSARVPAGDGKARLALGRWAESRGLYGPALAEYRAAGASEDQREEAQEAASRVESKLATVLFDRGEEKFVLRDFAAARQHFALLVERFPKSPVVEVARARLKSIDKELAAAAKAAAASSAKGPSRTLGSWKETIERATKLAKKASKHEQQAVHGSTAGKQIAALKRAVRYLEQAWRELQSLGPTPQDAPADRVGYARALTASTKQHLVKAYLDIGTAYLLRRSLAQADEYCAKACGLAPEDMESHALHKRLIEARLINEWGAASHARVAGGNR